MLPTRLCVLLAIKYLRSLMISLQQKWRKVLERKGAHISTKDAPAKIENKFIFFFFFSFFCLNK
jgi:hypothetical protein